MWSTCENNNKKRRVEQKELLNDKKRKFSKVETPKKKEYCKFKKVSQYSFLKRERLYQNNEYYCLIHHEKNICDIYDCRGVHTYSRNNSVLMPYII